MLAKTQGKHKTENGLKRIRSFVTENRSRAQFQNFFSTKYLPVILNINVCKMLTLMLGPCLAWIKHYIIYCFSCIIAKVHQKS